MADLSTAELALRLIVAGVGIIGPTLLYFGLWRFLMWLRDDELVEALVERGVLEEPHASPASVMATSRGSGRGSGGSGSPMAPVDVMTDSTGTCKNCGSPTSPGEQVCWTCRDDQSRDGSER
jgi:hypothetical protein